MLVMEVRHHAVVLVAIIMVATAQGVQAMFLVAELARGVMVGVSMRMAVSVERGVLLCTNTKPLPVGNDHHPT